MSKIEKFNGTFYQEWKQEIQDLMVQKDCWPIEKMPESKGKADDKDLAEEIERISLKEMKALSLVRLNMSREQARNLRLVKSATEAFELLDKVHIVKSPALLESLTIELDQLRYKMGHDMSAFILKFEMTKARLEDVGSKMCALEYRTRLLKAVPTELDYLKQIIRSKGSYNNDDPKNDSRCIGYSKGLWR